MNSRGWSRTLKLAALGGASFWLPDTLIHLIGGRAFGGKDVIAVTLILPATLLLAFIMATRRYRNTGNQRIGLPMLAGVWLFGGLFMVLEFSFVGGGFAGPHGVRGGLILVLMSLFPMYTYIMSAYDGSLLALLFATVGALVIWIGGNILRRFIHRRAAAR